MIISLSMRYMEKVEWERVEADANAEYAKSIVDWYSEQMAVSDSLDALSGHKSS